MRSLALACVLLVSTAAPAVAPVALAQAGQVTRSIPWDGDDALTVTLGSDVVYTQGPRAGVTVTGERALVEHVLVRDGKIYLDTEWARQFWERGESLGKVRVTVTAPAVERFVFNSGGSFAIQNYNRDELNFVHNGGGSAQVSGAADSVRYVLNGGASVDLSKLRTNTARVIVNGRGDLQVGAREAMWANVNGSGSITLLNTPAQLRRQVNGSGQIVGG